MAFNQWQQKINQINEEYHSTYEISWSYDHKFKQLLFKSKFGLLAYNFSAYNYRNSYINCIYHWNGKQWINVEVSSNNYYRKN